MSTNSGTAFHAELDDDRASLHGPGLGVVFRRHGDRWTEAIFSPDPAIERITAAELQPSDESPSRLAHPVYQEVRLHKTSGRAGVCLLLTGLAFHHHFSAAVTLTPDESGRVRLDFDIADRCRAPIDVLAATYLVRLDSGALLAADPTRIAWNLESPGAGRLELLAGPESSLALAEAGRRATRVQILAAIRNPDRTHRLRYGWRWTSADALTR
jgi:hypothetical protein